MSRNFLVLLFRFLVLVATVRRTLSTAFPTLLTSVYTQQSHSHFLWPISSTPAPAPTPEPSSSGVKAGYWPSWLAENFPPSTIPTIYFNHLFYAFVAIDEFTNQLLISQADDQRMMNFTSTLHAKKPQAKAFLSIGGSSSSPNTFSNMASNATNRAAFIKSSIEVARKYGFDGLDLDWEFPSTPGDMSNLALLLKDWFYAIENESLSSNQPRLLLAAAVYLASNFFLSDHRTYPSEAISKYVDLVNLMCFDYHGSWDTSLTGEHALLYDKSSNISTSYGILSWIEAGVPPEKLVMGLPLYGRTWQLKDPNVTGIGAPAVGVGPGNNGIMSYNDISGFNLANLATVVYDEDTVSVYSYSGNNWIGYDGVASIAVKVKFAKDQNLGGYFFWALGDDKNWTLSSAASNTWDNNL